MSTKRITNYELQMTNTIKGIKNLEAPPQRTREALDATNDELMFNYELRVGDQLRITSWRSITNY